MFRKLVKRNIFGVVAITLVIISNPSIVTAFASTSVDLNIKSVDCTIDETYSSSQPQYALNPDICNKLHPSSIPVQPPTNTTTQPTSQAQTSNGNTRPGNQAVLEKSIFEPLAYSLGIGNASKSSAQPLIAIATFVCGSLALTAILVRRTHKPRV